MLARVSGAAAFRSRVRTSSTYADSAACRLLSLRMHVECSHARKRGCLRDSLTRIPCPSSHTCHCAAGRGRLQEGTASQGTCCRNGGSGLRMSHCSSTPGYNAARPFSQNSVRDVPFHAQPELLLRIRYTICSHVDRWLLLGCVAEGRPCQVSVCQQRLKHVKLPARPCSENLWRLARSVDGFSLTSTMEGMLYFAARSVQDEHFSPSARAPRVQRLCEANQS